MIHLAFSSFSIIRMIAGGRTAADLFGPLEWDEYSRLKIPARLAEWEASRLAVKKMIKEAVPGTESLPLPSIQIQKEASGAPYVVVDGLGRLPGCLSISHSNGFVFIGYAEETTLFGVDLELVAERSKEFVLDYFTETEIEYLENCAADHKPSIITLLWSAKEAALKAARLGLRLDTRRIEITPHACFEISPFWQTASINCLELGLNFPRLFWRSEEGFIQTYCVNSMGPVETGWVKL
jgi:phosphopantetheinyl transferase